jgi:hypothetical protein
MFYRIMKIIFWSAFGSAFVTAAFFAVQEDVFGVVTFLLTAIGLSALFLIQKSKLFLKHYNQSFGDTILGLSGIIFIIGDLGDLYLYDNWASYWFGFDTIAHFTIPAIFMIVAAMLYESLRIKKGVPNVVEVFLISALAIVIFSFLWELFERQSDIWWGTRMFWNPDRPIAVDTADDLVADFYGVFIGGVLIFKNWNFWNKKWLKKNIDN